MDGDNERPEVNMADYKLPDIPWHIGYVIKDEDAPIRHKLRCIYNDGKKCLNGNITEFCGSALC